MVEEHEMIRHLTEIVIDPTHAERTESSEYRHTKEALRADGHYKCWVCGTTEDLQVHHFGCEWMFANVVDFKKLKDLLMIFDIYGYSHAMADKPIESVDDIRNMMVLCQEHHTGGMTDGVANGIHQITFPAWLIQKTAKTGEDPVPENSEDLKEDLS